MASRKAWWTVVGLYDEDDADNYVEWVRGATAREAVEACLAEEPGRKLGRVIAVLYGKHTDRYTADERYAEGCRPGLT